MLITPYLYNSVNMVNGEYCGTKGIVEYDKEGRVELIKAPAGSDGALIAVARFVYKKNETEVFDALGRKKVYRLQRRSFNRD